MTFLSKLLLPRNDFGAGKVGNVAVAVKFVVSAILVNFKHFTHNINSNQKALYFYLHSS